jgi:cell wall-associated NlpC family hydrolase
MTPHEIARRYIGTPYKHQGRVIGVGIDCVGLIVCVAREIGAVAPDFNVTGYPRIPDGHSLMRHLRERFIEIDQDEMRPGDVVCVSLTGYPTHIGIVGDYPGGRLSVIHATIHEQKVVEHRLMFTSMKYESAFRFGVSNG